MSTASVGAVSIARCQALEVPATLRQEIASLQEHWQQGAVAATAERNANVAEDLYLWVSQSMTSASPGEVVGALKMVLPVVDDVQATLRTRTVRMANQPLRAGYAIWQHGDKQILALRIEGLNSRSTAQAAFARGFPPLLAGKQGGALTVSRINDWSTDADVSVYTIHGFLPSSQPDEWPDVLLSAGPEGHGLFFYVMQLHVAAGPPVSWKRVWQFDQAYTERIDFQVKPRLLTIEFGLGRDTKKNGTETFKLKHGAEAELVAPPKAAGVPDVSQ